MDGADVLGERDICHHVASWKQAVCSIGLRTLPAAPSAPEETCLRVRWGICSLKMRGGRNSSKCCQKLLF